MPSCGSPRYIESKGERKRGSRGARISSLAFNAASLIERGILRPRALKNRATTLFVGCLKVVLLVLKFAVPLFQLAWCTLDDRSTFTATCRRCRTSAGTYAVARSLGAIAERVGRTVQASRENPQNLSLPAQDRQHPHGLSYLSEANQPKSDTGSAASRSATSSRGSQIRTPSLSASTAPIARKCSTPGSSPPWPRCGR